MVSIYQSLILDHYRHPRNFGRLDYPSKNVSVSNPFCGDKIEMAAVFNKGKLIDIRFSGVGCAISIASASLLTEFAKNKTKTSLQKLDKNFIINMLGIKIGPTRLKCALLSLEALQKMLF